MVWEVTYLALPQTGIGILVEADCIEEAIEEGRKYGQVVEAKISETMND